MTAQLSGPQFATLWLLALAGVLVLAVWVYLWLFHHRFWTTRIPPVAQAAAESNRSTATVKGKSATLATAADAPAEPAVLVVIPARNEAEVIARTVADVLLQDYAGALHLIVVNDNSQDATAACARQSAQDVLGSLPPHLAAKRRFSVINGSPLPAGWSGKLWAVEQGIRHGLASQPAAPDTPPVTPAAPPTSVWLTDADISHAPNVLRELIARARDDNRALVSRMALLCTDTAAERWTIPAFVYFFQMLYPFTAIANRRSGIHGAAGGCILLERAYLEKIGGIASLRGALIDDCTLAAHVARAGGGLWLELTKSSVSQRGYGGARGVSDMIARTAYTQLRYSPLRLAGTVLGLLFTFFCPLLLPLAAITLLASPAGGDAVSQNAGMASGGAVTETASPVADAVFADTVFANAVLTDAVFTDSVPQLLAELPAILAIGCPLLAAAIMFGTFVPMLRFYRLSPLRALALPLIAAFYLSATIKSAIRHYRGRTGNWKGRVYQNG